MSIHSFRLLLLWAGLALAVEIVDLSDQNVTAVDDGSPWFLFLYAPWCQVCAAVEPIFTKLASKHTGPTRFARADATSQNSIADRFNVRGFPTMIVIDGGRHMEYRGPRDESSLARVADRLATEAVTPLTGDLLLDGAATVYVACGAQIPEGFGDAAGRLRLENGFHVAPNTHPRCPAPDTVVAYAEGRPFDQHSFIAPGLEEWIHSHRLGVVRELGRGNGSTVGLHQIEGSTRPLVVLATVDKRCIDTLSKVAWDTTDAGHMLHEAFTFVWINVHAFARYVGNTFGLTAGEAPRVAVYNVRDNTYALAAAGTECDGEALARFLGQVMAGQAEWRGGAVERWMRWGWGLAGQAWEFSWDNPGAATTTLVMVGLVLYALATMPERPADDRPAFTKAEAALNAAFDRGADAASIEQLKAAVLAERAKAD